MSSAKALPAVAAQAWLTPALLRKTRRSHAAAGQLFQAAIFQAFPAESVVLR